MQQTIQRKQLVEADVLTISEQRIAEDLYNNSDLSPLSFYPKTDHYAVACRKGELFVYFTAISSRFRNMIVSKTDRCDDI